MTLYRALIRTLYRRLYIRLYRFVGTFIGTFIGVLGAQLGSITNVIYRVGDKLSNGGIGELRSAILGVKVQY